MGGNPRAGQPHIVRPSPLQHESSHTLSSSPTPTPPHPPTSGLVRDPLFWKRFSVAIHMAELEPDEETGRARKGSVKSGNTATTSSSIAKKSGDDWLSQQRKEKRRCRVLCAVITIIAMILIAGGAFCGWYFTHHTIQI